MKRTVFILTAFLAVMSCTLSQDLDVPDAAQDAVSFDVYTHGALETKTGYPGEINLDALKVTGFGVYGYISSKPDFMANQHVTYSGGWVYSPVKYWPNQDGVNINFYAYAPYVEQSDFATLAAAQEDAALTNPTKEGIVYVHHNNEASTPKIVYRTPADPSNSVDLMFGVAAEAHTSPVVTAGLPFLNMTKLKLGEKMKFNFKHALTKLVVNVDGYFDEVNGGTPGNNNVDPNTRVVIKSVKIKTTQLAVGGTLDLNNTVANTPKWTVGTSTTLSAFNESAGYDLPIASYLKYIEDNTESVTHFSQQPLGVTKTTQSLMGYGIDGTTAASLLFVPNGAAADLTIAITYEIITRDPNLGKGYNRTENPITQTISAANLGSNAFKPGYATTLNLHLGLASVKFDAEITNWESGETENVDLPVNEAIPVFSVGDNKHVVFSKGNLQATWDGSSWKWHLADNQYSTASGNGLINGAMTLSSPGTVDLFGWSTDASPQFFYGIHNSDQNADYSGSYKEWGEGHDIYLSSSSSATIGSGWRVLSGGDEGEWQYLLSTRTTVDHQRAIVKLSEHGNMYGLVVFPDGYDFSDCPISSFTDVTNLSNDQWGVLDEKGVVFLPAAGIRSASSVLNYSLYGKYWSSTTRDDLHARMISFDCSGYCSPNNGDDRYVGYSVRLVKDVD